MDKGIKTRKDGKTWSWIVIFVTLAYLIVETSFSSELLNIVGQKASTADINNIEHWGRYISGFAAGLLFWSCLTPSWLGSVSRALFLNILVTMGVMFGVYHWEMSIVNTAKANNSGIQRKTAVYAAFVRSGLLDGTVTLTGMPQGAQAYHTPEGKAFIALLPLLADSEGRLSSKVHGVLHTVVENNVRVQLHGSQGFYDHVFLPSAQHMAKAWTSYQNMVAHLNAGYQAANRAPSYAQPSMVRQANGRFQVGFQKAFSLPNEPAHVNPANVTNARDFFSLPCIVRLWAHSLRTPALTRPMMPDESFQQVRAEVWPVYLQSTTQHQLRAFKSDTKAFKDSGPYAQQGRNATVLLKVPSLALILSVLGMLVHSAKLIFYGQKVMTSGNRASGWFPKKLVVALLISGSVGYAFYLLPNSITQAPLYRHMLTDYQLEKHAMWPSWALTWVIQAEHFIYPVADWLRQNLMLGYRFGVTPLGK